MGETGGELCCPEAHAPSSGGRGPRRQAGSPLPTKGDSRAVTAGTRPLRPSAEGGVHSSHFPVTFVGGKIPSSRSVTEKCLAVRGSGSPPAPHGAEIGVSAGLAPGDSRLGAISGPSSASRSSRARQRGRRFGAGDPDLSRVVILLTGIVSCFSLNWTNVKSVCIELTPGAGGGEPPSPAVTRRGLFSVCLLLTPTPLRPAAPSLLGRWEAAGTQHADVLSFSAVPGGPRLHSSQELTSRPLPSGAKAPREHTP